MSRSPAGGSTSLADFKQLALLGEGAYSAVYKVLRLADQEVYALKKVKLPSLSDKEKSNALNEVRLLASVRHENVIDYKEAFFDDKTRSLCIVTECADGGDLLQQITRCKKDRTYVQEGDAWRYLIGMCRGLKALHDLRILHRDMKCANVFLSALPEGPTAKLGDFNVSKVAKRGLCMTQTGTPYYASPEVWRDMPYDAKSDMWSLGCVLYELVALRPPFRAEDMEGLYRKVVRGLYPRIPPHYSQDLADVIAALLQVHPRHRPSVDQLLQMPQMARHMNDMALKEVGASDLLSTIKLPKNADQLSVCLPKPRYELSQDTIEERSFESSPTVSPEAKRRGGDDRSTVSAARERLAESTAVQRQRSDTSALPTPDGPPPLPRREGQHPRPANPGARGARPPPPGRYRDPTPTYQQEQRGAELLPPPPSGEPPPSEVMPDSLDAYMQQQVNPSPSQPDRNRLPPLKGSGDQGSRADPPAHQRQNSDDGIPPSATGADGGRASPAPSANRALPRLYGNSPNRRGEGRRPMSIYARQQYALYTPSSGQQPPQQQQQQQPPPSEQPKTQQTGGTSRLRLAMPRIF